jgi:Fic family protein
MRRIARYIHERSQWPSFTWDDTSLALTLADVRYQQGRLMGKLEGLGFRLREEASLSTLTLDVVKTSEIEGERLPMDQVRSSIAMKLGLHVAGMVKADRHVEGVVEMMLNATQQCQKPLTKQRLFSWHGALFPTGFSGMHKIDAGRWRDTSGDPMQVVSGAMGKERVHFEAPGGAVLEKEMKHFIEWFNRSGGIDPVLKAAVAHLWFVTIHPFDDGNGRVARAIADMQLSRADGSSQRFYSMSAQIQKERSTYYSVLEKTQRGDLDITLWMTWFVQCLGRAIAASAQNLQGVLNKARFWEDHQQTALNERQRKMLNKLMDGFEGKLTTSKWAKMGRCSSDTALRDIQDLATKKILTMEKGGGRSTSYRLNI